jgi:hypothetical protein
LIAHRGIASIKLLKLFLEMLNHETAEMIITYTPIDQPIFFNNLTLLCFTYKYETNLHINKRTKMTMNRSPDVSGYGLHRQDKIVKTILLIQFYTNQLRD